MDSQTSGGEVSVVSESDPAGVVPVLSGQTAQQAFPLFNGAPIIEYPVKPMKHVDAAVPPFQRRPEPFEEVHPL